MTKPLDGLKILDFTCLLPGPFATKILGDMGASVMRIQAPHRLDLMQLMKPGDADGVSYAHHYLNDQKSTLVLNLKDADAKSQIRELVQEYDIVCEGFRPGVMAKLGLGYDDLKLVQPKLIYGSLSGFGQAGSMSHRAGHDINFQALSGIASYNGTREGLVANGFQIADIAGGSLQLVVGLLAAVVFRQRTGMGQWVDCSMTDASFYLNHFYVENARYGNVPMPGTEFLNGASLYGIYRTKDDKYVAVGSLEPESLKTLLHTLGLSGLWPSAMDFSLSNQQNIREELAKVFTAKTRDEWQLVFRGVDCCVDPVLDVHEAMNSPLGRERGWQSSSDDKGGKRWFPIRFS